MRNNFGTAFCSVVLASFISVLASGASALAQVTYTDTVGSDHYGGAEVDISSVVISNDATNITFQINMNPAADIGTNHFANYEFGIQIGGGAGGQTAINGTFGTGNAAAGNPYGNSVGFSTGENFFIGNFLDNPGNFSGGVSSILTQAPRGGRKSARPHQ